MDPISSDDVTFGSGSRGHQCRSVRQWAGAGSWRRVFRVSRRGARRGCSWSEKIWHRRRRDSALPREAVSVRHLLPLCVRHPPSSRRESPEKRISLGKNLGVCDYPHIRGDSLFPAVQRWMFPFVRLWVHPVSTKRWVPSFSTHL